MNKYSGGALLFALITALVFSLICSTLVLLTSNQYKIVNDEISRTKAFYLTQAGMEYAINNAYNNTPGWLPESDSITHNITLDEKNIEIEITHPDPAGISTYAIRVTAPYE